MKLDIYDGQTSPKYTLELDASSGWFRALRYGEPWRDLVGDTLVYWMAVEIDYLRKRNIELQEIIEELEG